MPHSISVIYSIISVLVCAGLAGWIICQAMGKPADMPRPSRIASYDEYFHRLFDETAIAYHDIDTNGIIRRVNRAECDLLGYEPEQLVGKPVWELVSPEAQAESRKAVDAKLSREVELNPFRRAYLRKDGSLLTLEIHENILFDESGNTIGIRSALLDISRSVRAEIELKESNRLFQEMANSAPVMLWITGPEGQITFANDRWLQFTGRSLQEALGFDWRGLIHADDAAALFQASGHVAPPMDVFQVEFRFRRFDGQYRWILSSGVPRYSETGEFQGCIGSNVDITERRATEERLRLLESVVVNATEGVLITDAEMEEPGPRILYVNESFTRVTGYGLSDVQGKSPRLLHGPLTDKKQLAALRAAIKQGKPAQVELLNYRKDGSTFWNEMEVVPVNDARGRFTHCIALQRDVTERKRVENEIQRYARELKQKNQALAAALEAARESTELKSRFLANMSHEIRTPMNGIAGMVDLLLTTPLNPEQQEYADAVRQSANSLLVVINDILDLSRIEAGKLELDCVPFNPRALVKEAVSLPALAARTKGLKLSCDLAHDIPDCVVGDPARIRQVITNLVGNALKFTEQGSVEISVRVLETLAQGVSIHIAVQDTGIGIPHDQCARLFHRFSQADGSLTRKHGGSGLGLAISRQLVELMEGKIGVETESGKGSTFWFTLTLPTQSPARTPGEEAPSQISLPLVRMSAKRVLVAEDNEINRRIALRILQKSGFEAEAVENGRLALEALQKTHYDLVLMDVQMPEMDGFEATMAIRKLDSAVREIPIIAMTANAMAGDREKCLASGMDDYITKPVSVPLLRSKLEQWTQNKSVAPESLAHV